MDIDSHTTHLKKLLAVKAAREEAKKTKNGEASTQNQDHDDNAQTRDKSLQRNGQRERGAEDQREQAPESRPNGDSARQGGDNNGRSMKTGEGDTGNAIWNGRTRSASKQD